MWVRNFMFWIIGTLYNKAEQLPLMPNYSATVTCMGYSRRLSPKNSLLWLLNMKMYLSRQPKGKDVYSQHKAGMFATAHFSGLVQSTPSHSKQSPWSTAFVNVL